MSRLHILLAAPAFALAATAACAEAHCTTADAATASCETTTENAITDGADLLPEDAEADGIDDQPYATAGQSVPLFEGETNDPRASSPTPVEVRVGDLAGLPVHAKGEPVGSVELITANDDGHPLAAVIRLNAKTENVANLSENASQNGSKTKARIVSVPLTDLSISADQTRLDTDFTLMALEQMPRFEIPDPL